MPGFNRLALATLVGRTGQQAASIALVLFVLSRYHSPGLAGFTLAAWSIPGLLLSPMAGALLDRYGRGRLIALDFGVAVASLVSIGTLSLAGLLTPWLLVLIAGAGSLTAMLSNSGLRTYYATLVPPRLWPRANAIDSNGWTVETLVGPPAAGALVGAVGGGWTLVAIGGVLTIAAAAVYGLPENRDADTPTRGLVREAILGLRYFGRHRTLRGLAITMTAANIGFGIVLIAVPVLLLGQLHQGPQTVGGTFAITGAVGVVSALLAGRLRMEGRERAWMALAIALEAFGIALLIVAHTVWVVLAAAAVIGLANGPFDVSLFTLRQRRTDPAHYGRAFAISMALNFVGEPIGSAVGGPLVGRSLVLAVLTAAGSSLTGAGLALLVIPSDDAFSREQAGPFGTPTGQA